MNKLLVWKFSLLFANSPVLESPDIVMHLTLHIYNWWKKITLLPSFLTNSLELIFANG